MEEWQGDGEKVGTAERECPCINEVSSHSDNDEPL